MSSIYTQYEWYARKLKRLDRSIYTAVQNWSNLWQTDTHRRRATAYTALSRARSVKITQMLTMSSHLACETPVSRQMCVVSANRNIDWLNCDIFIDRVSTESNGVNIVITRCRLLCHDLDCGGEFFGDDLASCRNSSISCGCGICDCESPQQKLISGKLLAIGFAATMQLLSNYFHLLLVTF